MAKKPLPPAEELRQLLRYEPETGHLYWRERPIEMFPAEWLCRSWNSQHAGNRALTQTRHGYNKGKILNTDYFAHRIIWKMVHGHDPVGEIDHINGDPFDNRLENLRDVSPMENSRNRRPATASGILGVSWNTLSKKWRARVNGDARESIELGHFVCFGEAVKVRKEALRRYGYHENHGAR